MNNRIARQRGFTLTEVLVAAAIFALIFVGALIVYDRSNRSFKGSVESSEMQQSTRIGFNKLLSDVRMIGFDYDRDGVPVTPGSSQQPDEQIEYAGTSAIVFRANFDYNTDIVHDHGLEPAYTPTGGQFPVVTTANDEIVIYALKSKNTAVNTGSLTFYADTARPRAAYPGGTAEAEVTVEGIDLTNNNPPYTLYRFTLDDNGDVTAGVPIVDNVRSLRFNYYSDVTGTTLITNGAGTAVAQGAIGGAGQYDPDNIGATTNFADRDKRASIASVRVELVGMNENPDLSYVNPNETSTMASLQAVKKYRTYRLESLVVPRNLGMAGMQEPDPNAPPPATVKSACTGNCDVVVLTWDPPSSGTVDKYEVYYGTTSGGPYTNTFQAYQQLTAAVSGLDSGTTYYFKVYAWNANGATPSTNEIAATPLNTTKPSPVTDLTAGPAVPNQVDLSWTRPTTNDASLQTLSCSGTGGSTSAAALSPAETIYYKIWRSRTAGFDPIANPSSAVVVLDETNATQPTGTTSMTWTDSRTNAKAAAGGVANCVQYYYRIQAFDHCSLTPSENSPANSATGQSTLSTIVTATPGYAGTPPAPNTPAQPTIDVAGSSCNPAGNNCTVRMTFPAVLTDTTATPIVVDKYEIFRERKAASSSTWETLTTDIITPAAQLGSPIPYVDNNMSDHNASGSKYTFRYSVRAYNCATTSAYGPTVTYPVACPASNVTQSGADNNGGDGATSATPWVMNQGDSVIVAPPAGATWTITSVTFALTAAATGTPINSVTDAASPFVFTWTNLSDNSLYQLTMTVTHSDGCTESITRYIQDAPGLNCQVSTAAPTSATTVPNGTCSSKISSTTFTYTIKNDATEAVTLKEITISFSLPTTYGDAKITQITYGSTNVSQGTISYSSPGTGTLTIPVTAPTIAASSTNYPIKIRFSYSKCDNVGVAMTSTPITKMCLGYEIPSETGVTKHCNIIGQSAVTANPGACD